jgi:hypothetical protein
MTQLIDNRRIETSIGDSFFLKAHYTSFRPVVNLIRPIRLSRSTPFRDYPFKLAFGERLQPPNKYLCYWFPAICRPSKPASPIRVSISLDDQQTHRSTRLSRLKAESIQSKVPRVSHKKSSERNTISISSDMTDILALSFRASALTEWISTHWNQFRIRSILREMNRETKLCYPCSVAKFFLPIELSLRK